MRVVRAMSQSLCIVLLLFTCSALSAQNSSAQKPSAQKDDHRVWNIVLVHGAWADGSGWKAVYDILVKDGFTVSMVQERRPLKRMSPHEARPCVTRRPVHPGRSQLWGSRDYGGWDGSIRRRFGLHRGPHARRRRE